MGDKRKRSQTTPTPKISPEGKYHRQHGPQVGSAPAAQGASGAGAAEAEPSGEQTEDGESSKTYADQVSGSGNGASNDQQGPSQAKRAKIDPVASVLESDLGLVVSQVIRITRKTSNSEEVVEKLVDVNGTSWSKILSPAWSDALSQAAKSAMDERFAREMAGKPPGVSEWYPRVVHSEYSGGKVYILCVDQRSLEWAQSIWEGLQAIEERFKATPSKQLPENVTLQAKIPCFMDPKVKTQRDWYPIAVNSNISGLPAMSQHVETKRFNITGGSDLKIIFRVDRSMLANLRGGNGHSGKLPGCLKLHAGNFPIHVQGQGKSILDITDEEIVFQRTPM